MLGAPWPQRQRRILRSIGSDTRGALLFRAHRATWKAFSRCLSEVGLGGERMCQSVGMTQLGFTASYNIT